jgi:hypothetical protein
VQFEAHDRKWLEQLCRCVTRPPPSDERVQLKAAGQVELKLKTPRRDGTTRVVMSPVEFMQRLAELVPRPGLHPIRFGDRVTLLREVRGPPLREHGVLAPNAELRALVVVPPRLPKEEEATSEAAAASQCEVETAQARPGTPAGRGCPSGCSISTCSTSRTAGSAC